MKVTVIAIAALVTVVGIADSKELTPLKGSNTKQLLRHRGLENKGKGEGTEGLPEKANTDNNGVGGLFQDKSASDNFPGEGAGDGQGTENGVGLGVDGCDCSTIFLCGGCDCALSEGSPLCKLCCA